MKNSQILPTDIKTIAWDMLDFAGDELFIVDQTGEILSLNQNAGAHLNQKPRNNPQKNISGFFQETNSHHIKLLLSQVLDTQNPVSFVEKQGSHWYQTTIYPYKPTDDRAAVIAIYRRDITQLIETQEKLKRVTIQLVNAQEDERNRISRDLHDEIGQRMTALLFELRSTRDQLVHGQTITEGSINSLIRGFESVLKHIRQIFYQLHPPSLNKVELSKVLEGFCSTFQETSRLQIDFSCQKEFPMLPDTHTMAIYRFIQEGLTNVSTHARATSAWINLDYSNNEINVTLEDNGHGFDVSTMREGLGIQGIRERFFILGGSFEIESVKGKGTQVSGTLPFTN
jgi:signal transduction histidine kinase